MRKTTFALLLLVWAGILPVWSSLESELDFLGFSDDGSYIAFQTSGFGTGSGLGFSRIQIVDVAANDFAREDFVVEGDLVDQSFESMKSSVLAQAQAALEQYGIVRENRGNLVYHLQAKTPWEQLLRFRKSAEFNLKDEKEQTMRYEVILEEREVPAEYCKNLKAFDLEARIFTLSVRGRDFSKVLQADRVLYRSRYCPYAYEIFQIYIYRDSIAVFLNARSVGWEGDDVYKLVVTGLLDRSLPARGDL